MLFCWVLASDLLGDVVCFVLLVSLVAWNSPATLCFCCWFAVFLCWVSSGSLLLLVLFCSIVFVFLSFCRRGSFRVSQKMAVLGVACVYS